MNVYCILNVIIHSESILVKIARTKKAATEYIWNTNKITKMEDGKYYIDKSEYYIIEEHTLLEEEN